MSDYFDAVDALIAGSKALPPPAERERLRKAHGLTQEQVAAALDVRRATIVSWESGKTEPRPPKRDAYQRLLDKLAELYSPTSPSGSDVAAVPQPVPAPSQGEPVPVPPASVGRETQQPGPAASRRRAGPL